MEFVHFKNAVAAQFERMQRTGQLFRTNVDKDGLWNEYLAAYPPGTNEVFRKRREHDCACCRGFIKAVGNVVAITGGKIVSVWDVQVPEEPGFDVVAAALSKMVKAQAIAEPFLHYEHKAGTDHTFDEYLGNAKRWDHFFVNLRPEFVMKRADISIKLGVLRADHDVFLRSLRELRLEDVDTVLDLIAQNSLYRGAEHTNTLTQFRYAMVDAAVMTEAELDQYAWTSTAPAAVKRIRNTAIGTLLVDLAEGKSLEYAVKGFETKVAPANYKRTTALVTPAMVKKAREEVAALGLTSALERRYATLRDLDINHLLFADRTTRAAISGDAFDDLPLARSGNMKYLDKTEEVTVEKFLSSILPRAESVEVLLENRHGPNLVSLIAPADPTAQRLFKWPNLFSWSYNGDMADAIRERVKQAGGNVEGDLCCRLAWHSPSDLDLHLFAPDGHIYYHNKRVGHGVLDLDMNGIDRHDPENPVENIFFADRSRMREGDYELRVNLYSSRSIKNAFEAQIDYLGNVTTFAYDKALRTGEWVTVAEFRYTHAAGVKIFRSLPSSQASRTMWGLQTQGFHKVRAVMLSPNYWGERGTGNKHYFFMLEGCTNDGTARGFFNEFLTGELDKHRKVLEMVGARMQAGGPDQLSGLGFSSTARNTLVCRVKGSFNRLVKIVF